jgi:hypothetical protein
MQLSTTCDAAYGVHADMKDHTGMLAALGQGQIRHCGQIRQAEAPHQIIYGIRTCCS